MPSNSSSQFPFSLFAISAVRKFIYRNSIHRRAKSLEDLGNRFLKYVDQNSYAEWLEEAQKCDQVYKSQSVEFVDFFSTHYPPLLREIYDPPLVLFVLGNPAILNQKWVAVVGTRKASPISLYGTRNLVKGFHKDVGFLLDEGETEEQMGVVSGMALGIDREATSVSLDMGFSTLGVLGTSVTKEYPSANKNLYKRMKYSDNAALVSEYLPYENYSKWTFPMRNRIITGIAEKVFVMEAPIKSGAMSSANSAIDQNKDLLIFDHTHQSRNEGGRLLIEMGATGFGLEDLGINGKVIHINDRLDSPGDNGENSIIQALADWKEKEQQGLAERLGDGYYVIF
ncbi:MAG: DNA-protecting protein DprA [Leptospira sp.]|nr:DNA-protecting protein DprA [Leptospira sp.]